MKYYYDCEFLEGTQGKKFLGFTYGKTKPTIDLISIGIVSEDNREFYAVSKDFNLQEAWNRYDLKPNYEKGGKKKVYWIRENVLKPIFDDLSDKDYPDSPITSFTYDALKYLINKYGYTNTQITESIKEFVGYPQYNYVHTQKIHSVQSGRRLDSPSAPIFYGYYSAYDHVALCWLFGKMIDLPKGFPMYTVDLKQELDEKINTMQLFYSGGLLSAEKDRVCTFNEKLNRVRLDPNYPQQINEHNALADARWNKELHEFILSL
jgi:hypothetical protein